MNGTIEVKSKPGEGLTFTFCIPCRIASREDTQPKKVDLRSHHDQWEGKRILLAEDNDLNAEISIELLSETGLVIDRAEDGVKCLEMLEQAPGHTYDLILMDVQMPTLDGYETTERIRKMPDPAKAQIPIDCQCLCGRSGKGAVCWDERPYRKAHRYKQAAFHVRKIFIKKGPNHQAVRAFLKFSAADDSPASILWDWYHPAPIRPGSFHSGLPFRPYIERSLGLLLNAAALFPAALK